MKEFNQDDSFVMIEMRHTTISNTIPMFRFNGWRDQ